MAQTIKEAKRAEAEAYLRRVQTVLEEAHRAAVAAFAEFIEASPLAATDGRMTDLCGSADVIVYKPSCRLRAALKAINEIQRADGGAWCVSNFSRAVNQQGVTARRTACEAARAVLVQHFPGEGDFYAKGVVD